MRRKTVSRCALECESLEEKALLAGDVSVAIVDGNLLVRGDAEANHILVESSVDHQQIVIRGLPGVGGIDTTLNGQAGPVVIGGLGRELDIRMGAGNDVVDVPRGAFRNVTVAGGRGDDVVRLGGETATNAPPAAVHIAGDLTVHLAHGADRLRVEHVNVSGQAVLGGGRGADHISITALHADRALISGGRGADAVVVLGSSINHLALQTGAGHDQAAVVDSAFEELRVDLGRGNDRMAMGGTDVAGTALINGGEGRDRLTRLGGNSSDRFAIVGFEAIRDGIDQDEPDEILSA